MSIPIRLLEFLNSRRVPYELLVHAKGFTAQELAEIEGVPGSQTEGCADCANGDSLPKKNASKLARRGTHRAQYGDVFCTVGHSHREHHQNVQAGYHGDQPDKNRSDELLQVQGSE